MINRQFLDQSLVYKLMVESGKFPSPNLESTMTYDYNKLMNILQKQEINNLIKNHELIKVGVAHAVKYHDITRALVSLGPQMSILQAYNDHQEIIENTLSGDMAVFTKQWGLSVKALYYYKRKMFISAVNLSVECIILSDYLVEKGIYSLLFRILEQNKNISRVYFKNREVDHGATIAGDLLNYLFNGECGILEGRTLKNLKYWSEMPYVREGYSYECFLAFVSLFIHFSDETYSSSKLFKIMFGTLRFAINTPDRLIIANWISIKNLFHNNLINDFLSEFLLYMAEPTSKLYNLLKISLVLDVISLLKDKCDEDSRTAKKNLNKFLKQQLNADEILGHDLSTRNLVVIE